MWHIGVRLSSGSVRFLSLETAERPEAAGTLSIFLEGRGDYSSEWLKTTDGKHVRRAEIVEAWLYDGQPVSEG